MDDDDFAELFKKLPSRSSSEATWQDVAAEFEALGKTLGDVLRGAWREQSNDAGLTRLREAVDSMVQDLNRAIDGTPEAQKAREQVVHLTETIGAAAAQASDELRPELIRMLRQANAELRRRTQPDA